MDKEEKKRTLKQNRALHKLFTLYAETLNEAGLDQRKVLKETIEIPWTPESFKEQIWRAIQRAQLEKTSTTELTTKEIDKVFDTINRFMGEKFSLHVNFPSIEDVINQQRISESSHKENG